MNRTQFHHFSRKRTIESAFLVLLILAAVFLLGWCCPFYCLLQIPCPGCGMTRAAISLMSGHLMESLQYHLFLIPTLLMAVFYAFFWLRQNRKMLNAVLILWTAGMIVCWMIRVTGIWPWYAMPV